MTPPSSEERSAERVLVLAPVGRDAPLTASMLESAGRHAVICADAAALAGEIERGAGVVLLTSEALVPAAIAVLGDAVARQPAWSDFPFLVFTSFATGDAGARLLSSLSRLGNVALLERPARVATLVSAVDAALRARRRQYEVRDLVGQLRDGMQQRDQFLAMLGHELRNPLSALLTAVQILEHVETAAPTPKSEEARRSSRAVLARQGQILARLVDDLLEVARVTSGKVALQRARIDMREIVQRSTDAVRPLAEKNGQELRYSPPSDPVWLDGDATRLEQVLLNVLTNALKYTPARGHVAVHLTRDAEDVVVSVRDDGMGIDAATLPAIFDLFRQGARTLDRAQGGLGVGLTLVRRLVELHGGSVSARSEGLGQGSEFIVRLPAAADATVAAPRPERVAEPPAARRRIFVVEDNPDNREGLVTFLRAVGHDVDSEPDGAAAVRRMLETRPEVALVDIGLPGLDGYGVARALRAALGPALYLIALTGYGQEEDRQRAFAAGFDEHMSKPIDFARLRRLLQPRPVAVAQ
jgi:signal transduction histidine kinase/CheY-like chemotaxis protein